MRVCIVGAGLMGRWHADAARRAGGSIVAVVDADVDRAAALARRVSHAGVPAISDASLARAAARAQTDVVHVCSPLETHVGIVREAIDVGAHVLVEKPLAPTAAETDELLDLADRAGRMLVPVHQFVFQRSVQRLLRSPGALGAVVHLDAVICSAGADSGSAGDADRIAADILPHPLSLAQLWFGESICDATWRVHAAVAGEWRISASRDGASIGILVSMSGRPTANTLRFIGDRGTAHLDLFHDFGVIEPGGVSRAKKIVRPLRLSGGTLVAASANLVRRAWAGERAYPGLRSLVRALYEAIRTGAAPPIGAAAVRDVARTRDLLEHLAQQSRRGDAST